MVRIQRDMEESELYMTFLFLFDVFIFKAYIYVAFFFSYSAEQYHISWVQAELYMLKSWMVSEDNKELKGDN